MRNLAIAVRCLLTVVILFAGLEASAQGLSQPLGAMLNTDGSLKADAAGSFDPRGYRMTKGTNGEPRFVRAEANPAGCGDNWDTTFVTNGADNDVNVIVSDGAGNLYIGGDFNTVQGAPIAGIAKWNGATWSGVGGGTTGAVNAIAISGTDIYIGGDFAGVGGTSAKNVAKWDGTSWSALGAGLGGGTHVVKAIAAFGSDVYIGGNFNLQDGSPANGLVRWNGTAFSAVGPGIFGQVEALQVFDGALYAGGFISVVGDTTMNGLLKWDGVSWSGFGLSSNTTVTAIGFNGGNIYLGGQIRTAAGLNVEIGRWDGVAWTSFGNFSDSPAVYTLAFVGNEVYAGGNFQRSGGIGIGNGVLKYNGTQWTAIGTGTELGSHQVKAIHVSGNTLLMGGDFQLAGGVAAKNLATLTGGTTWSAAFPGTGIDSPALAIAVSGTDVYVGGTFLGAGSITVNRIAKWNSITNNWSALGTGVSGSGTEFSSISAIAVAGGKVYAGGTFPRIGGVTTSPNIAVWNGTAWAALGTGTNGPVTAIVTKGEDVYIGGNFTTAGGIAANKVAKWNGTAWSSLNSTSIPTTVSGMAFMGDDLYISTGSTTIVNPAYFSKYDGTNWTGLGGELGDRGVTSIAVLGTDVYVAGGFYTTSGGLTVNRIAKWNGTSWSALGGGLPGPNLQPGSIRLAADGDGIIAVGDFTIATGAPANYIARWNGSAWTPLGTGLNGGGLAVTSAGGDIFVGGPFTMAGCNASPYFARWRQTVWTGSTSSDWHIGPNWGSGLVPSAGSGVSITAANSTITSTDVTLNSLIIGNGRTLSIGAGRTLTVTGRLDVANGALVGPGSLVVNGDLNLDGGDLSALGSIVINGNLYLGTGKIVGSGTVSLTSCRTTALAGGNSTSFIASPFTRCINSAGIYRFPVGTDLVYAPVELSNIVGSGNFTVEPKAGAYPGNPAGLPANRLQRWWDLTNGGVTQTDITLNYIDSEVVGLESFYRVYRVAGAAQQLPTTINTTTNRMTVAGVTSFSGWTLAEGTPTPRTLVGRVTGAQGRGASLVIVSLTDSEGNVRYATTNPLGYYRFQDVLTFRPYTVGMMSKKYTFTAPQRLVQFDEFTPSVNFSATDH